MSIIHIFTFFFDTSLSNFTSKGLFNECGMHSDLNRLDNIWGRTLLASQFKKFLTLTLSPFPKHNILDNLIFTILQWSPKYFYTPLWKHLPCSCFLRCGALQPEHAYKDLLFKVESVSFMADKLHILFHDIWILPKCWSLVRLYLLHHSRLADYKTHKVRNASNGPNLNVVSAR